MISEDYWQTLPPVDYLTFTPSREAILALDDLIEGIYPDYQNRSTRDFLDFLGFSREYVAEWDVKDPKEIAEIRANAEPEWLLRAIILRLGEREAAITIAAHPNCPQDWALWFAQRTRMQSEMRFHLASFQSDVMLELLLNPYTTGEVLHEIALHYAARRNLEYRSSYYWDDFLKNKNTRPETIDVIVNFIIDTESNFYETDEENDFYSPHILCGPLLLAHPSLTRDSFLAFFNHHVKLTRSFTRNLGTYSEQYRETMTAFISPSLEYGSLIPDDIKSVLLVKAACA